MPPFHDFFSARHEECQLVLVFRSDSRYFTGKRIEIVRLQNFCGKPVQSIFRDLLGWTGIFPKGVEGGADPNRSCPGDFPTVMLAAASAFDQPGKRICLFSFPWVGMFLCPALNLILNRKISIGINNGLMAVFYMVVNIEKLNKETYIRNFSEMVFHDSKRLQSISNPISRILMDYGDGIGEKETILAQNNLISNPGYVYIKGDWQIWCQERHISVNMFRGGIAVSSDALDAIDRIAVPGGTIISVENLTTYHDTKESQGAIIYLGGFMNTVRTNLLKKLYVFEPDARYFHKGDLDPYGFLILENLKKKTGIPFEPLEMDLDTLRQCHRAGHFRPLDEADKKAIISPALAEYQPILQYMIQHNCKIEQECFEAMKLEQLVGV